MTILDRRRGRFATGAIEPPIGFPQKVGGFRARAATKRGRPSLAGPVRGVFLLAVRPRRGHDFGVFGPPKQAHFLCYVIYRTQSVDIARTYRDPVQPLAWERSQLLSASIPIPGAFRRGRPSDRPSRSVAGRRGPAPTGRGGPAVRLSRSSTVRMRSRPLLWRTRWLTATSPPSPRRQVTPCAMTYPPTRSYICYDQRHSRGARRNIAPTQPRLPEPACGERQLPVLQLVRQPHQRRWWPAPRDHPGRPALRPQPAVQRPEPGQRALAHHHAGGRKHHHLPVQRLGTAPRHLVPVRHQGWLGPQLPAGLRTTWSLFPSTRSPPADPSWWPRGTGVLLGRHAA